MICWDVVGKNTLQRIEGHTDVVLAVDTAELDGKSLLVSCGLDQTVRVWEEVGNVRVDGPVKVNGDTMEVTPDHAAEAESKSTSHEAQNGVEDDKMVS
jgi:COMPASS component SWD3